MNEKLKNEIKQNMYKYSSDEFERYTAEAGWEEWMEAYTDSLDGEELSESEGKEIEKIQRELWDEVHNDDN